MLADSFFNVLKTVTTDSQGEYGFSVTLSSYYPYYLSAGKSGFVAETKSVTGMVNTILIFECAIVAI